MMVPAELLMGFLCILVLAAFAGYRRAKQAHAHAIESMEHVLCAELKGAMGIPSNLIRMDETAQTPSYSPAMAPTRPEDIDVIKDLGEAAVNAYMCLCLLEVRHEDDASIRDAVLVGLREALNAAVPGWDTGESYHEG